jgi:hypothetical protein
MDSLSPLTPVKPLAAAIWVYRLRLSIISRFSAGLPGAALPACGSYPPCLTRKVCGGWRLIDGSCRPSGIFARYAISGILFATAAIRRVRNAFSAATAKRSGRQSSPHIAIQLPEQFATVLIVPFQGANADQQLYVLFSFDAAR